jgi:leucyl-tRNA synthetase
MADEIPPQRYTAALANEIEHKWQDRWDEQHVFDTPNRTGLLSEDPRGIADRPHMFVLDMFPYPSGVGLHVGHPLGYIATDVYARFQRMNGFNVLHAMGYDAFGLPAEQYAVQTGTHPRTTTEQNIANMKRQLRALGLGHDPRRGHARPRQARPRGRGRDGAGRRRRAREAHAKRVTIGGDHARSNAITSPSATPSIEIRASR